ncbi:MAG: epoxide hydrolase, partial [Actinomycetota bacterium]
AGVHLNFLITPPDRDQAALSEQERVALDRMRRYQQELSGYFRIQSTRPQTLAYAMHDSPTGLLAWIAEKFTEWSDPASVIDADDQLTNVMLYWLTGTAGSAMRLYWEEAHAQGPASAQPSSVPTGVAIFPHEIAPPVRHIADRTDNIVHWSPQPRGGHFAALEEPGLLIDDVRAFFRGLR